MKRLTFIVMAAVACLQFMNSHPVSAQAPQGFAYQAVVRDNSGAAVANRTVAVRIALVQGNALGVERYAELHEPATDAAGLFSITVGQGTPLVNSTMELSVDWSAGPWFLKTQVDPDGGQNFILVTTQQLMSVPYALYAANAGGGLEDELAALRAALDSIRRDTVFVREVVRVRDSVVYDTFALHPYDRSPADVEGTLPGVFSISAANRIAFSRGNLQCRASTQTWRFAQHQEDMVGTANANISMTDTGWIDLFGYGTSGYNGKYPHTSSSSVSSYVTGDIATTHYDWGVHNTIEGGGDTAGVWRTLAANEWNYLVSGRSNATALRARATVNGIPGLILLPDNWTAVSGVAIYTNANDFTTNNYNNTQWNQLQDAGAVFLPAAGYRDGVTLSKVTQVGYYWSSSYYGSNTSYIFSFGSDIQFLSRYVFYGYSVRLVRDLTVLP
ncbi:MAG: hypothetical protein J6I49_08840 [Bacteroidales bacterium]|nr:hypothetical protein [Bacteroidales bacterium]